MFVPVLHRQLESEDSKGGLSRVRHTGYGSDGEEPDLWLSELRGLSWVKMLWSFWQETPGTSGMVPADEEAASVHAEEQTG